MSTAQQPADNNGIARIRKPRLRSTIGTNPLDVSPLPPMMADSGPAAPASPTPAGEPDPGDSGRGVFAAWATSTEGVLNALFVTQTAALQANLSVLEAGASAQRQILDGWTRAASQAQAAAIEAFRTAGRHAASPPPMNGEEQSQQA